MIRRVVRLKGTSEDYVLTVECCIVDGVGTESLNVGTKGVLSTRFGQPVEGKLAVMQHQLPISHASYRGES